MQGPSLSSLWVRSSLPIVSVVGWRVSMRPWWVMEMLPASTPGIVATAEVTICPSVSSRCSRLRRPAMLRAAARNAVMSSSF